jgi:holo-[acyl-carrier protein] synthase
MKENKERSNMAFPATSIGVDIIEIHRIQQAVEKWQDRFLQRIYTDRELQDCDRRWPSLAARFAAKEAVLKALGTSKDIGWHDIEIRRNENDAPYICLHSNALTIAGQLGIRNFAISLSHSEKYAVAVSIANA